MEAEEEDWFQPSYEWTSRTTDMDSGVVTLTATAHDGTTLEMRMLQDMGMFSQFKTCFVFFSCSSAIPLFI